MNFACEKGVWMQNFDNNDSKGEFVVTVKNSDTSEDAEFVEPRGRWSINTIVLALFTRAPLHLSRHWSPYWPLWSYHLPKHIFRLYMAWGRKG